MVLCLTSAGLLVFSSSHMRYLGCMRCVHPPLVSREPHASRLHAIWTHPSFRLWSAAQASGNWLGSSAASNSAGGDVATAASAAMLPSVDALQAAVLGFEWASSIVDGGLPGGAGQLAPRRACSLLVRSAHALAGSTGLVPQLTSAPRDAMIDSCAHQPDGEHLPHSAVPGAASGAVEYAGAGRPGQGSSVLGCSTRRAEAPFVPGGPQTVPAIRRPGEHGPSCAPQAARTAGGGVRRHLRGHRWGRLAGRFCGAAVAAAGACHRRSRACPRRDPRPATPLLPPLEEVIAGDPSGQLTDNAV